MNEYCISEEEASERRRAAEALTDQMGFGKGSRATFINIKHRPGSTEFVIRKNEPVGMITGIPGNKNEKVTPESVSVVVGTGTEFSNEKLSDLARLREMSDEGLLNERDGLNKVYWDKYGKKPEYLSGIQTNRSRLRKVLIGLLAAGGLATASYYGYQEIKGDISSDHSK